MESIAIFKATSFASEPPLEMYILQLFFIFPGATAASFSEKMVRGSLMKEVKRCIDLSACSLTAATTFG